MEWRYLLIINFFFFSCLPSSPKTSEELIPRAMFKEILIRLENTQLMNQNEILNINDSILLNTILIEKNYSLELYNKTLEFYIKNPELFLSILHEIKDSISNSN